MTAQRADTEGMPEPITPRRRTVTELQREATEIVREANDHGEVEITRYGETVAYVLSPSERRRQVAMDKAVERTIWAVDYERAMKAAAEGRILDWEEVAARLRARFIDR